MVLGFFFHVHVAHLIYLRNHTAVVANISDFCFCIQIQECIVQNDGISRHGALHRNHRICFPCVLSIRHSFKNTVRISFQLKTDSTFYVRNQVETEWITHTHYIKISMTALKASTYWVNCRKYEFLFGFLWVSHMKYPVSFMRLSTKY